ncbi:MAG: DJ-1/PfpI family protein [Actinobacteria bacterium]|nr:DJ-1/PfpI family protein [Actinomycetota bacterium]
MQARGRAVAVLMPNHFDANLFRILRDCIIGGGGTILIVGFKEGEPLTDSERKEVFTIDIATEDLGLGDYDALVILDSSTPEEIKASKINLDLVLRSYEHQKVLGAVDRGVELLVAALGDLLGGREVTGPAESRIDLEATGSIYIGKSVVVDKYLITARTANDAEQFCQVLLDMLQTIGGIAA